MTPPNPMASNPSTSTGSYSRVSGTSAKSSSSSSSSSLSRPRRLVSFGRYAGLAGTLDTFHELGKRLLYKYHGATTPFLSFPSNCIMFYNVEEAKNYIQNTLSDRIVLQGIPIPEPIVFVVTGSNTGAVYQGVMEALTLLPHTIITVPELAELYTKDPKPVQNQIYICHADPASIYEKQDFLID